jgi:hypothetical protein
MFENLARLTEDTPEVEHVVTFTDIQNNNALFVRILSYLFSDSKKHIPKYGLVNTQWRNTVQSMKSMQTWYRKALLSLAQKTEGDIIETNISFFELPKCFFDMPLDTLLPLQFTNDQRTIVSFIFPKIQITLYNVIVESVNTLFQDKNYKKQSRFHDGFLRDDIEEEEQEEEPEPLKKTKLTVPPDFSLMSQSISKHGAFITLNHGGYYATSQFDMRGKEIRHKTFHKYVTRKKQGGRQITQDKAKKAKSMGSQIRRTQEEHFKEELQEHLVEWQEYFRPCQMVFIHAPGPYNESLLFEFDDSPLNQRYCYTIPFNTQQPTNSQVLQASTKLFNVTLTTRKG